MRRTTISLPDDLADALDREARRRRLPVSQVVREAIEARLPGRAHRFSFTAIAHSEHPSTLSRDVEELLDEMADDIHKDAFGR